jgi:hypothetical protein
MVTWFSSSRRWSWRGVFHRRIVFTFWFSFAIFAYLIGSSLLDRHVKSERCILFLKLMLDLGLHELVVVNLMTGLLCRWILHIVLGNLKKFLLVQVVYRS